ncbi:sigma-70 family RNA polymerase sigma factor [Enterovirga sp. CN4-39]|uniref:sigma-70 family RNA polymerase sigma factor n=1 Tax=Enterovirga sp. CN4-39 TaxID=3400910 RepID=UPI003C0DFE36
MERVEFERQALEHLDAVHSVACWIVRSRADADDIVQETYLRAFQAIDGFRGEAIKPWLLTITRNLAYTFLTRRRRVANVIPFDEAVSRGGDGTPMPMQFPTDEPSAEARLVSEAEAESVRRALEALPLPLRETVVLREMEELSYQQIADVIDVPIGTVMSRLSRARAQLRRLLADEEGRHAV